MSTNRETTSIVRSWLEDGATRLPERVLDAVLDELPATPQRRVRWWPARRIEPTNAMLTYGLVAAIVVAVAILIGINAVGTPNVGGPGLDAWSPTPEASVAEASATLSADASASADPVGDLPRGPFVLTDGEVDGMVNVPTTLTIPGPGWYGQRGDGILMNIPEQLDFSDGDAGMIGPFTGDIYVPADPCEWTTTMPDTPATTVDEVVAALQAQATRDASEPVDITVDGRNGKSITLRTPDDVNLDQCDRGQLCTLTQDDPAVCHRWQQFNGQIDEIWIVDVDFDVDGVVAVIDATWGEATSAEELAELRAILDSMTFDEP